MTASNEHCYDLRCSLDNCIYKTPVTCGTVSLLTDHGHTIDNYHRYTYVCNSCSYTFFVEKPCESNCPIQIFTTKPQIEYE